MTLEEINAVTLSTANMARAVDFYLRLGFDIVYGGPEARFTSLHVGRQFLNLQFVAGYRAGELWGRLIFHVSDVDEVHRRALDAGFQPETRPRDAEWGERYFHIRDPDGHELSFAKLL